MGRTVADLADLAERPDAMVEELQKQGVRLHEDFLRDPSRQAVATISCVYKALLAQYVVIGARHPPHIPYNSPHPGRPRGASRRVTPTTTKDQSTHREEQRPC